MGRDKALIPLDGKRLIEHVIERVLGFSDDLFITTNHAETLKDLKLRMVADDVPGRGALFGLRTAMRAAQHEYVLIVACDMPFLQPALIQHMLSLQDQADVIIPELNGEFEPLLALYRISACLPALERALDEQKRRMISFFPDVQVLPLRSATIEKYDPARLSFININTPQDAQAAEQRIRELDRQSSDQAPAGQLSNHPLESQDAH